MKTLMSFPIYDGCLEDCGSYEALLSECRARSCLGIEAICGDASAAMPPRGAAAGYHLVFWPDWLDFWRGDERALLRKFGSRAVCEGFYGFSGKDGMLEAYRRDMERAATLGAEYVVFHVSDVSVEEGYTYAWEHGDEEVIDAACGLMNALTDGHEWPFAVLAENQWWPGFKFTEPDKTMRLMDGLHVKNKGIMLDTGHLLSTNTALRSEGEAVDYIHAMLDKHGESARFVRGLHLHKSLSGEYVAANTGRLPDELSGGYLDRFAQSYAHILRIDRHEPWTEPRVAGVVERVSPEWLTHELAAATLRERLARVSEQAETLKRGLI